MSVLFSDLLHEPTWQTALTKEWSKPYLHSLQAAVATAYQTTTVYPQPANLFRALNLCPLPNVRVVIIGQDPYHGPGQADGLAFSVPTQTPIPPSLRNIFTEIEHDISVTMPSHGSLERWAQQGVLLLNSTLTVVAHTPAAHRKLGWEQLTDQIIQIVSRHHTGIVFLLWGAAAKQKATLIDHDHHYVLTAPHPSPLSVHRGFFGCRHFSDTNRYLEQTGNRPISW